MAGTTHTFGFLWILWILSLDVARRFSDCLFHHFLLWSWLPISFSPHFSFHIFENFQAFLPLVDPSSESVTKSSPCSTWERVRRHRFTSRRQREGFQLPTHASGLLFKKISPYQKTECNLPTQMLTSFLRLFFLHQNSHPSNTRLTWYTPGRLGLGHTPQTLCCLWSRGWSPYPTFWSTYEKMIHSFPSITGCHCEWWFKCWGSQFTSSKGAFVKIALEIVKSCGNLRGCRAATLWLSNSQGSAELLQPGLNVRVACISIGCAILTLRQCHDASQSNTAKQHDLQVLLLSSSCAI